MGLCKCPKKRVTNQFCFEHRVNVCEHCLVANHPKCIVQSYLKWLQDSDYEPVCQLCKKDLAADDCVRLLCYHVFHWGCVDAFARQLPPQTAPAGFMCPSCNTALFPAVNTVSPVADALRQTLSRVNWARAGLGLPMIDEVPLPSSMGLDSPVNSHHHHQHHHPQLQQQQQQPQQQQVLQENSGETSPLLKGSQQQHSSHHMSSSNHTMSVGMDRFTSQANQMESFPNSSIFTSVAFTSPRKLYDTTEKDNLRRPVFVDHDEDKYKRRSALEWFSRWFKSRTTLGRHSHSHGLRPDPRLLYKRWFLLGLLIFLGLCTLVLIFVRLGRASADVDPLLDPHLNPNIRVDNSMDTGQGPEGLAAAQGLGIYREPKGEQRL